MIMADTKKPLTKAEKREQMKNKKKMPKDYNFSKDVKEEKLYKDNIQRRDRVARKKLIDECNGAGESSIFPGQLIMFNYLAPATMDELKYWDAEPVTIFFGHMKNKKGQNRVLGFNIHYYPPRIRYRLMTRVIEIFRPFYEEWQNPLKKEIGRFEYSMFMSQLKKAKLDFGVRMYDPGLMGKITPIPVAKWTLAALTEGNFKKTTRQAIMNYWKNWVESKKY